MESVSRVWTVGAVGLAVTLSVVSSGTLLARQDPPAQQAAAPAQQEDTLKLTAKVPTLIVSFVKPDRAADFEAAWAMIRDVFEKTDRPEVKEFGATFTKFWKVDTGSPAAPNAPAVYVFQLDNPSTTQTYHPLKMVYEFLYYIKEGKEGGIPRTQADEIFKKLNDVYMQITPWPLMKMGT